MSKKFDYTKIIKLAIDLKKAKINSNEEFDKSTIIKYGLFEGGWEKIPEEIYMSNGFKKFIEQNFESVPYLCCDDNNTYIFKRNQT